MVITMSALARRFELVCERLLDASGYRAASLQTPGGPDILAEDENGERFAVEVKLYRSVHVDRSILRNAAAQLVRYKQRNQTKGMLIASALFDERDQKLLRHIGVDEVWDLSMIANKASGHTELSSELEQLFRDAEIEYARAVIDLPIGSDESESRSVPAKTLSEDLIDAFKGTRPGLPDAKTFEDLCSRSIKHLFGEHLGQLQEQHRVEQGLQYMDLIARLIPQQTSAFWLSLSQDFRCRYIVFEFKNYTNEISQNQIYTTEKYLYPTALRSVAIIIARSGADSGALRASQGALREMGKLIIILDLNQLFDLLRAKDHGTEPSDIMIDHLDRILTTIAP